eukprot:Polyplicarium_translucidae@DN1012_c0_g1_i1.p1
MLLASLAQLPLCVSDATRAFFGGPESEGRRSEPLSDALASAPQRTLNVLRWVFLTSLLWSFVITLATTVYLRSSWERAGACNKPLRWWLFFNGSSHLLQLPLRLGFLLLFQRELRLAVPGDLARRCSRITNSAAWRVSHRLSLASLVWFVLGVMWCSGADADEVPDLVLFTIVVLTFSLARVVSVLVWLSMCLPSGLFSFDLDRIHPDWDGHGRRVCRGLAVCAIEALPVLRFSAGDFREDSCSICLTELDEGDELRQLPCGHHFHPGCVDRWLKRRASCPLCLQALTRRKVA